MESMSHRCWITLWYMKETILEPFPPLHKKNWDLPDQCVSKSIVGIIDQCWNIMKYHDIAVFLCNAVQALFDLIWPSVYRATSMCSEMESMSHRCWITLWYMKETILEPFPPLHKKNWDIPDQCVSKSTVGIIDQCCISLQRYYKIYYTVLYKLPRFYNAYWTGGSTMIFFHSRTLRVYPQGGGAF